MYINEQLSYPGTLLAHCSATPLMLLAQPAGVTYHLSCTYMYLVRAKYLLTSTRPPYLVRRCRVPLFIHFSMLVAELVFLGMHSYYLGISLYCKKSHSWSRSSLEIFSNSFVISCYQLGFHADMLTLIPPCHRLGPQPLVQAWPAIESAISTGLGPSVRKRHLVVDRHIVDVHRARLDLFGEP